ncbi:membrane-associating domain-containing protein [Aspergillus bertholletiae]|uniref:Membrane-associating domain-containing protein n=1 Tax=Aspergillus bertholletiae TaxID=1226010 RepID=A0A5N7BEH3_9EURO|nr:membrane-associating domain-containing protein [Aspergillus bertholletiae]
MLSTSITRPLLLVTRVMQWSSAVIVMGITSYFIHKGPRGLSLKYQEIISTISVVFFIPAFVSPFMPSTLSKFVLLIDVVFSYLWLTAFIFAAQDYNKHNCRLGPPPGVACSKKHANEAFIFLTFIFTFFGMFLEVLSLWAYRRENTPVREKTGGAHGGPADAPVAQA